MIKITLKIWMLVVIVAFWGSLLQGIGSAETVKLQYIATVYADAKGEGIKYPQGVACSEKSMFIVADSGDGRLLRFTIENGTLKGGEEIRVSEMTYPTTAQINSKGDIFILDSIKRKILRIGSEGTFKGYVAIQGQSSSDDLVPRSFKLDSLDNIYILDMLNSRVVMLDSMGKYLKDIKYPEHYGFVSDLAVNRQGTIFLVDSVESMVYAVPKDAVAFSPLTKSMKDQVSFPSNIVVDSRGMIFLTDRHDGGVVMIGQDGVFRGRLSGYGWKEGLLRYPAQLCIGGNDEMIIADEMNNRVEIFTLSK